MLRLSLGFLPALGSSSGYLPHRGSMRASYTPLKQPGAPIRHQGDGSSLARRPGL